MDNGTEFNNKGIENFLQYNEMKPHFTTPNHHNSNGLINKAHATLIELMNLIKAQEKQITIDNQLKLALIAYNNMKNRNLKLTPNEITFGVVNKENNESQQLIFEQQTEQYHKEKTIIHNAIKTLIEKEKTDRTNNLNKNRERLEIPEGEIFIRTNTRNKAKEKYKKVIYDPIRKRVKTKTKIIKIHPDQLKRPKRYEKHNTNTDTHSRKQNDDDNTHNTDPQPGPSGL
jgi:hypothetical protein